MVHGEGKGKVLEYSLLYFNKRRGWRWSCPAFPMCKGVPAQVDASVNTILTSSMRILSYSYVNRSNAIPYNLVYLPSDEDDTIGCAIRIGGNNSAMLIILMKRMTITARTLWSVITIKRSKYASAYYLQENRTYRVYIIQQIRKGWFTISFSRGTNDYYSIFLYMV